MNFIGCCISAVASQAVAVNIYSNWHSNLPLVRPRNNAKLYGAKKGILMKHLESLVSVAARCVSAGISAALVVGASAYLMASTPANAKPEFAAQTGLPCSQCHQNPAGGGKLKSFGEKFKANGNKLPQK
jgi:hypothetical protein